MTRRLLLSFSPGEIWAALLDGGELAALRLIRTHDAAQPGDLYLGRIVELRRELGAALVDIGEPRPAFLDAEDVPEGMAPTNGQVVIARVTKAARSDKAAGLTMKLTATERQQAVLPPQAAPPLLLHRAAAPLPALLESFAMPQPDEVLIDDAAALAEVKRRFGDRVRLQDNVASLFESEGIAEIVETALARRIVLVDGGAIAIEATKAAILIDVDGGRRGALNANLAAVPEIARQIRLRDLAGPIVIDFIGMRLREQRDQVASALKDALGADTQYLGWTRLGHFELVRKRRRASLIELLFDDAGQKTSMTIALEALRQAQRESRATPEKHLALRVHPEIAACLEGAAREAKRELDARLGYTVRIVSESRPRKSVAVVPLLPIS